MEKESEKPKTVRVCITMSAELHEVLLLEANLRNMNKSELIEVILRENNEIKKIIERLYEITKGEELILTTGHGVKPKSDQNGKE